MSNSWLKQFQCSLKCSLSLFKCIAPERQNIEHVTKVPDMEYQRNKVLHTYNAVNSRNDRIKCIIQIKCNSSNVREGNS